MKNSTRIRPKISAQEKFFSVTEAAPLLHLHRQTVQVLCGSGRIRCCKPGKAYLIPASAIDEYLTARSVAMPA